MKIFFKTRNQVRTFCGASQQSKLNDNGADAPEGKRWAAELNGLKNRQPSEPKSRIVQI